MNFAVLVSGNGTNLQAIIDACSRGEITSLLKVVISNKAEAYALQRAGDAGVAAVFVDPKQYDDRVAYDAAVMEVLKKHSVDFIVLAGYMRILSVELINAYPGKILNIHPSLLPNFK